MNIQKYEAFLRTAELGSLTKAAEALGYTQSGMSHILNSMEEEWGVSLFVRDRSGARLTSDGVRLLPHIRAVCEAERDLAFEVDDLHGLQRGLLRIGTFVTVALHWLPRILKKFREDYPNIDVELLHGEYGEIAEWLVQGRVDCGFLRIPSGLDMATIPLGGDEFLVALPEGHPLAALDAIPIDALRDEEFILLAEGLEEDLTDFFRENDIVPKGRFTGWDYYTILAMVEVGLGITIQPALALHRSPYRIVKKRLEKPRRRKLGLVLRDLSRASAVTTRFLDYLQYREGED
ncbi:LysR family transcriptional regulator [Synergistaceae bacterium OttesenSCG-928-I11]|nr:LysR family transcriptional regulator [Synergistaceae bacterium OttesenSCG-928-I11]